MADRNLREELKQPDDFISFFAHLVKGLAPHSRGLVGLAVGLIFVALVVLVYGLVDTYRNRNAADAFVSVSKALAEGETADPSKILSDVNVFLAKYGSSRLAPTAYLLKSRMLMSLGKYDEALGTYKTAERGYSKPFKYLALEGEGFALAELKRFPEAEVVFKALSDAKDNPLRPEDLWNLGLAQEAAGHPDQALQTYESFESHFQNSAILEKVRSRIAQLRKK